MQNVTEEQRREQLASMTAAEIANVLVKLNPFGVYSSAAIERHRESYIESVIVWEYE